MFASLIRRKSGPALEGGSDAAFESTTVSLSTAVPRPAERRTDERVSAMLRVAKLTNASGEQQLVKVKNLSAGGLRAPTTKKPHNGGHVGIQRFPPKRPGTGGWARGGPGRPR